MRFRKATQTDGLRREDIIMDESKAYRTSSATEKLGRPNARFVLTFAAAVLIVTAVALSKFHSGPRSEGSWSLFSTDRGGGKYSRPPGYHKNKRGSSSVDSPDAHCTRSFLEKRSSSPKYDCDDIEVSSCYCPSFPYVWLCSGILMHHHHCWKKVFSRARIIFPNRRKSHHKC